MVMKVKVKTPSFADNVVNIKDFGAVADGKTLNTAAITKAIEKCSDLGGGRVVIPQGLWLTGPIVLKNNIELYTEAGALVLFTEDYSQYPVRKVDLNGVDHFLVTAPLYGENLENIAITGKGVFDGSGDHWRPVKKMKMTENQWRDLENSGGVIEDGRIWWPNESALNGPEILSRLEQKGNNATIEDYEEARIYLRPRLMSLVNCKRVLLDGPTFQNSPMWNLHPLLCEDITIRNISVRNPWFSQNGDGLDLESCKNVILEDSVFDVGDDAMCLKSGKDAMGREIGVPTENVLIRNCIVYHGHGGFVVGSEMSGGVRNITVSDCQFIGTDVGLRFKSTRGRGGVVEDIEINNVEMIDIKGAAITCDLYYEIKNGTENEQDVAVTEETPVFKNITMNNVICRGAGIGIFLRGLPEMPLQNIELNDIDITAHQGISCVNSVGHKFSNVHVEGPNGTELFNSNKQ